MSTLASYIDWSAPETEVTDGDLGVYEGFWTWAKDFGPFKAGSFGFYIWDLGEGWIQEFSEDGDILGEVHYSIGVSFP